MTELPDDAIVEEKFILASGPGGQNVNKVASAVQLRVNVFALRLPPYAYHKLKQIAGSRITAAGELVITAREYRTQEANRKAARERVAAMIAQALERAPRRIKTKPGKAAKARRVDEKKGRGQVKAGRARVRID